MVFSLPSREALGKEALSCQDKKRRPLGFPPASGPGTEAAGQLATVSTSGSP